MKLIVISPDHEHAREVDVLGKLFAAGLERYHVRKPGWSIAKLAAWLRALPADWRPRLVLHQHHELVAELGLGGAHFRDDNSVPSMPTPEAAGVRRDSISRSCHDLGTLQAGLGCYDYVFFGPVFPSVSKPGHGAAPTFSAEDLTGLLKTRTKEQRHTAVYALSGVTPRRIEQVRTMGFEGAAVLGAIWQSPDPAKAFRKLQQAATLMDDLVLLNTLIATQSICSHPPSISQ